MLQPGDTFGDYRVLKLLGKGGMGAVYLLRNAEGGEVAAKILDPAEAGDHESRRRFLREAELALGVKHPNLVETYDVGEDPETGLCYILMEYAPAGSLADRIKAGPLSINDAIRIVYQIASVLEFARGKGIVHRDIKPGNILFGADGKAKLADLGIARGGLAGVETTTVTQTGMMIGTPAYMAPEQMLDAHHVDTRADIYSLGVVFFEMLTGERPNKDDTVVQLMAKAVKGEPLPDVRTLRPEVSASVAELVSLMCAMKAEERISTPVEVTTAISQIVHGREVTIRRKAPKVVEKAAPARLPAVKSRLLAVGAFGAVALACIAVFAYLGASRHVSPEMDPVGRAPMIRTNIVERMVERPVGRTIAVTNVVERVPAVANGSADIAVVVGCDVSSHGGYAFYANSAYPGNALQFGRNVRVVPLQFKLTREVLGKVNLLVLSPGLFYGFDDCERDAIREFVESGGVVLALVHCTSSTPGESSGATVRLLKQYGAVVYNAPREARFGVRLASTLAAYGTVDAQPCSTYANCLADWTPLAFASDDSQKVVCAIRQVGTGFFILAPESYACARALGRTGGGVKFPWDRVLSSRLKPVRSPDVSFDGSTLDDAPYEARSSRLRFVSSVVSSEDLRWIAKMDDAAVEILTRRFGKDAFDRNPAHNCIVGFISNAMPMAWQKRLDALDAVELKSFTDKPAKRGLRGWALVEFLERSISRCRNVRPFPAPVSVTKYMACSVYDELQRKGYSLEADCGASAFVGFARMRDPDFVRYDGQGNPVAVGTPELNYADKQRYVSGRFYAMLEDLHQRKPDLFIRYRQVMLRRNGGNPSYEAVIEDLCTAYGGDWPRRWPAAEDAASVKKPAKESRGS